MRSTPAPPNTPSDAEETPRPTPWDAEAPTPGHRGARAETPLFSAGARVLHDEYANARVTFGRFAIGEGGSVAAIAAVASPRQPVILAPVNEHKAMPPALVAVDAGAAVPRSPPPVEEVAEEARA